MTRATRRWAVGLVAAVTAFLGVAAASAASIGVSSRDHSTATAARCTTSTIGVAPSGTPSGGTYAQVTLTSIPSACFGLAVSLVVYGSGGASLATGTGVTGSTGTATITTSSYAGSSVSGVALLVNTWGITSSWTPPASVLPTVTCIALNNGRNPQSSKTCSVTISASSGSYGNSVPPGGQMSNLTLSVTSTGAHWRVTLDFTGSTWQPLWAGQYSGQVQLPAGYSCPSPLSTLQVEDSSATWGATLYFGQNGAPTWWAGSGGTTLCP